MPNDWSREEVEATVADYLAMLASELAGVPYNKAARRRDLAKQLHNRSEQAIEFKHANISAVLVDLGFPYISGYKPRSNYQQLLHEVVSDRLTADPELLNVAAADADQPIVVPEVDDTLAVLTSPPASAEPPRAIQQPRARRSFSTNYLEREARNRSLGLAGEQFVLNFERARLLSLRRMAWLDASSTPHVCVGMEKVMTFSHSKSPGGSGSSKQDHEVRARIAVLRFEQ
jgi:hypothetical protein